MRKILSLPQYKGAMPLYDPQERTKRKNKNMDSHLFVTPAIFKPGSISVLRACGFPIKNLGNDKKRVSLLNGSIRGLNQGRGNPPFSVIARSD